MAKKIRFPLIMENGVEVRDIVSLRTHFSLPPLIEYKKNGKLVNWLRDRYETDLAKAVELIVIEPAQLFSAGRIGPNPIPESLLD